MTVADDEWGTSAPGEAGAAPASPEVSPASAHEPEPATPRSAGHAPEHIDEPPPATQASPATDRSAETASVPPVSSASPDSGPARRMTPPPKPLRRPSQPGMELGPLPVSSSVPIINAPGEPATPPSAVDPESRPPSLPPRPQSQPPPRPPSQPPPPPRAGSQPPPRSPSQPPLAPLPPPPMPAPEAAPVSTTPKSRPAVMAMKIIAVGKSEDGPPSLSRIERHAISAPVPAVAPEPVDEEVAPDSLEPESIDAEEVPPEQIAAAHAAKPPPPPKRDKPKAAAAPPPTSGEPTARDGAKPRRAWWEEVFGEDFLRAVPRSTPDAIKREVNFIEESLGVAPGGVVLDLGCGAGYHAVELASRGYGVVGYDLSLFQLSLAQEVAQEAQQKINFLQGDMREMAFEDMFDGVYCWNTSFGYFEEDKNLAVAQRVFKALRPGGMFLLDVVNRDFASSQAPGSCWYEGDACVCMDEMSIDYISSRLKVKRSIILDDGRSKELTYSLRIYSLHELGKLLHEVGFRVAEASGELATPGVFFGACSSRIIILAQKP